LAVDQGTELIRQAILTSADIGESIKADGPICCGEAAVLADKNYGSMTRREALAEIGITDRTMQRRHAGRRQPNWRKWMNGRDHATVRSDREALWHDEAPLPLSPRALPRPGAQPMPALAALHGHEPVKSESTHHLTGIEDLDRPILPQPIMDRAGVLRPRPPSIRHVLSLNLGLRLSRQSPWCVGRPMIIQEDPSSIGVGFVQVPL
jgi:hypothetical protein